MAEQPRALCFHCQVTGGPIIRETLLFTGGKASDLFFDAASTHNFTMTVRLAP